MTLDESLSPYSVCGTPEYPRTESPDPRSCILQGSKSEYRILFSPVELQRCEQGFDACLPGRTGDGVGRDS